MSENPAQIPSDEIPLAQLNTSNTAGRDSAFKESSRVRLLPVRGTSRGRARGTGLGIGKSSAATSGGGVGARRGGARSRRREFNCEDPSHNWNLESMELMLEHDFANKIFNEKGRMLCKSALERIEFRKLLARFHLEEQV